MAVLGMPLEGSGCNKHPGPDLVWQSWRPLSDFKHPKPGSHSETLVNAQLPVLQTAKGRNCRCTRPIAILRHLDRLRHFEASSQKHA